jgi:hypothetical protein
MSHYALFERLEFEFFPSFEVTHPSISLDYNDHSVLAYGVKLNQIRLLTQVAEVLFPVQVV